MKAAGALLAVGALGAAASARADCFTHYDTNHDGVVSQGEARRDPELLRVFARADADANGVLSPAEFQAAAVLVLKEQERAARGG